MRNPFLLINEQDVKELSIVGDNLDAKYIAPSIVAVQDVYLEPIIGSGVIVKLGQLIEADEIDLPENAIYKTLLTEYVQPYLLNKVISEIMVQVFAKIRNAGVVQWNDSNQTSNSINDVNYLRKHYDDIALVYSQRMTDFLCKNRTQIPEYRCTTEAGKVGVGGDESNNYCAIHF